MQQNVSHESPFVQKKINEYVGAINKATVHGNPYARVHKEWDVMETVSLPSVEPGFKREDILVEGNGYKTTKKIGNNKIIGSVNDFIVPFTDAKSPYKNNLRIQDHLIITTREINLGEKLYLEQQVKDDEPFIQLPLQILKQARLQEMVFEKKKAEPEFIDLTISSDEEMENSTELAYDEQPSGSSGEPPGKKARPERPKRERTTRSSASSANADLLMNNDSKNELVYVDEVTFELRDGLTKKEKGLFAKEAIKRNVRIVDMISPKIFNLSIPLEKATWESQLTEIEQYEIGKEDSFISKQNQIIWDSFFEVLNRMEGDKETSIPFWYRINHTKRDQNVTKHYDETNQSVYWKTAKNVKKGDELRVDYGYTEKNWL